MFGDSNLRLTPQVFIMLCISSEAWTSRPEVPYLLTQGNIKKLFRRCRWRLWWRWSSAPKFDGHRRFQTHPDQRCSDSVDSATSFSGCLSNAGSCMWLMVTCYYGWCFMFFLVDDYVWSIPSRYSWWSLLSFLAILFATGLAIFPDRYSSYTYLLIIFFRLLADLPRCSRNSFKAGWY